MENETNSSHPPSCGQGPAAQHQRHEHHRSVQRSSVQFEAPTQPSIITVVKEIHRWTCDHCGKPFPTYTEACTHEESCQPQQPHLLQQNPSSTSIRTNNDPPSADQASVSSVVHSGESSALAQSSLPLSKHTTTKRTRTKQVSTATEEASSSSHDAARSTCGPWLVASSCSKVKPSTSTENKKKKASSETRTRSKRSVVDLTCDNRQDATTDTTTAQSESKKKKRTTASKTNNNPKKPTESSNAASSSKSSSSIPLASIFHAAGVQDNQDMQRLLQEQATANFRAQRLEKERKQREIRLKKQQAAKKFPITSILAPPLVPNVSTTLDNNLCGSPTRRMKRLQASSPRFPIPSHVYSVAVSSSSAVLPSSSSLWWKDQGRTCTKQTIDQHRMEVVPSAISDWYKTILHEANDEAEQASCTTDPLQRLLQESLIPPQTGLQQSWDDDHHRHSQCWAERYYDTHTWTMDCPVRRQLRQFVQEWMVARHRAHVQLQHKQRQLARQRGSRSKNRRLFKMKKKQKKSNDVNDLWESDSDVERDGLPSLCLLTGPIGSGKTSMAHAVAKECHCSVMEINTTDKRSAAALKRMLEETTQSHSTLDMLQSKQYFQTRHESLVDTDAKSEDDYDHSDDEADGSSKQPLRALTLILLDEVDLLFDDDAGFWSALNQLAKRSKSPIVLTANSLPPGIHACRYLPLALSKPTNAQCEACIRNVLQEEGFSWRIPDDQERNRVLANLFELCHNDLRKVCRELQLYSHSCTAQLHPSSGEANSSNHCQRSDASIDILTVSVKLISVEPRSVLRDNYALLTIRGSGFLNLVHPKSPCLEGGGYAVSVCVGGRICPCARIVNDTTVLAVKAPSVSPILDVQNLHGTLPRLSCCDEYETVSLCSVHRLGVTSTTQGSLSHHITAAGHGFVSLANPLYIVSQLSSMTLPITPDNEGTDEEPEFEMECDEREHTLGSKALPNALASTDWERVERLFQDGLKAWKDDMVSRIESESSTPVPADTVKISMCSEVEFLAQQASWASDASILQDLACQGLPFLSKSCRGFGFEYTDAVPASCNDTSKPPTEERLYHLGWKEDHYFYGNCDTYMTSMTSAREQQLLKRQEAFRSCIGPSSMNVVGDSSDSSAVDDSADYGCYTDDALLPNCAPTCIRSFASSMMHQCPPQLLQPLTTFKLPEALLSCRTLVRMQEHLELLLAHLFTTDLYRARLFARGLGRSVDAFSRVPTEECDATIFLDYVPMFRVMALVYQDLRATAALAALQQSKSEEALSMSRTKRRSTRTSQRRSLHDGRHFLSELLPARYYYNNDNNSNGNEMDSAFGIVDRMAQWCLIHPVANSLQ